jgi:hypothetical protein
MRRAAAAIAQLEPAQACHDGLIGAGEAQCERARIERSVEAQQGILLGGPPCAGSRRARCGADRHAQRARAPANRFGRAADRLGDLGGGAQRRQAP